jgi:hypothetical protein
MTTDQVFDTSSQLLQWQQDFVGAALKLDRPSAIVLEAATGSGVLRALAALADEVMLRGDRRARILVLTPDSLVENMVGVLGRYSNLSPIALEGSVLRRLRFEAADTDELWPHGIAVVAGFRSARSPLRYSAIKSSSWDLVIVDQAVAWGADLRPLLDSIQIDLTVVVANPRHAAEFDSLAGGQAIRWDVSRLDIATAESIAARSAAMALAGFRRSEPEKQLLDGLGELTRSFSDHPGEWLRADLTAAALTSPQMLEGTLLDLEASLSDAASSHGPDADMVDIKLSASFQPHDEVEIIEPISAIRAQIAALLNALYAIPADPKCEALKKLLVHLWRDNADPTLVLSVDPATATYVAETLGTTDRFVLVESRLTVAERLDLLARPNLRAAVASDSAVAGLELPGPWRIINYDLPRTELAMEVRWQLLARVAPKVMWTLADLERSVRLEGELLLLHGF